MHKAIRVWPARIVIIAGLAAGTIGCASTAKIATPSTVDARRVTNAAPIVIVVEENHSAAAILAATNLTQVHSLIQRGTLLTNYYAIGHPSLPNYLALVSGSTFGITSDCLKCFQSSQTIADQLTAARHSWKIYAQGLPTRCAKVNEQGAYARRHNPLMYFDSIRHNPTMCNNVVPFTEYGTDLAAGNLPEFSMIIPDLNRDMHGVNETDTPTLQRDADQFLGNLYASLSTSAQWTGAARLIITWDEAGPFNPVPRGCCGGDAHGGRIATIVVAPRPAHPPTTDSGFYDHYSLLRSLETRFGLAYLKGAAHPQTLDIPSITKP